MNQGRNRSYFLICGVKLISFRKLLDKDGSITFLEPRCKVVGKLKMLKKEFKGLNASRFGDVSVQNVAKYNKMIEA